MTKYVYPGWGMFDVCRRFGGTRKVKKQTQPLPAYLQVRARKPRTGQVKAGALTSRVGDPCLVRFCMASGEHIPTGIPQTIPAYRIQPKSLSKFLVRLKRTRSPFASFTDAAEAFAFAASLTHFRKDPYEVVQVS